MGRPDRVPTHVPPPYDARFLPLQVLRKILHMHLVTVCLGSFGALVHQANATGGSVPPRATGVPRLAIHIRFSRLSVPLRPCFEFIGLLRGADSTLRFFEPAGNSPQYEKRVLGGAHVWEHLGILVNTEQMKLFVNGRKVCRVRDLSKKILVAATRKARQD